VVVVMVEVAVIAICDGGTILLFYHNIIISFDIAATKQIYISTTRYTATAGIRARAGDNAKRSVLHPSLDDRGDYFQMYFYESATMHGMYRIRV